MIYITKILILKSPSIRFNNKGLSILPFISLTATVGKTTNNKIANLMLKSRPKIYPY